MSHMKSFPITVTLKESQSSSHPHQKAVKETMQDPSNIDLLLECEDDQSYALPRPNGPTNGLQLHASSNVSMRISFSSCTASRLSCPYCQCNFLIEPHLIEHMQKFHNGYESADDDGDDDGDDDQVADEDHLVDDDDDDDGEEDNDDALESLPLEKSIVGVKTEMITPGYVRASAMPPSSGTTTASTEKYTNGLVSPFPSLQALYMSKSTPILPQKAAAATRNLKRKSVARETISNPPLTLTIKKSKSTYEIQKEEDSLVPVFPATQMREENCDVQSDSANETIDVESSSPYSSPGSGKNEVRTVVNGRKNVAAKFFCEQCQKSYVSKYALKRHVATHSDARPFVCNFPNCNGAFKLKSRLTDHIRYVHKRKTPRTGKRSKSEPDTSSLVQVLLSSSPVPGKPSAQTKLYKCPLDNCNREFRDAYNLESHMCLHTGRMPYKCDLCSFSTIQKTSLDWHMQAKHPKS